MDLLKRNFVVAYARQFLDEMEHLVARACPPDCNYIEGFAFVKRDTSNFRSWAAYNKFHILTHWYISPFDVFDQYMLECADYHLTDDVVDMIYALHPFALIHTDWKYDFEMCVHELLLQ